MSTPAQVTEAHRRISDTIAGIVYAGEYHARSSECDKLIADREAISVEQRAAAEAERDGWKIRYDEASHIIDKLRRENDGAAAAVAEIENIGQLTGCNHTEGLSRCLREKMEAAESERDEFHRQLKASLDDTRTAVSERDHLRAEVEELRLKWASPELYNQTVEQLDQLRVDRDDCSRNALEQMNARHAADERAAGFIAEVHRLKACLTEIAPTLLNGRGGWALAEIAPAVFALFAEASRLRKDLNHCWSLAPVHEGETVGFALERAVLALRQRAERAEAELNEMTLTKRRWETLAGERGDALVRVEVELANARGYRL